MDAQKFYYIPPNGRMYDLVAPNPGVAANIDALIGKYALRYTTEEGEDPHPQEGEPIQVFRPITDVVDEDGNVTGTTGNDQWYTKTSKVIDPNESLEGPE